MAARLEGNQPVVITVRASSDTRRITTDWRAVDARDASHVFNVRSTSPGERRDYIDILCQLGVAV
jgi:head-tail adaptor